MTLPIDARSDGAATMRDLSEEMHKVITRLENLLEELIEITCGDIFAALDSYEDVSAEALQQSIRRNMNMAVTSLRAGQAPTPAELDPAATTTTERFHSGVSIDQVIIAFRMSFSLIHSRFIDFSFERLAAPELIRGSQILTDVSDAFTVRAVQTFHQLVVESAVADAARRSTALRNVLAGDFTPGAEGLALQINPLEPYAAIRVSVPGNLNAEQVRRQLCHQYLRGRVRQWQPPSTPTPSSAPLPRVSRERPTASPSLIPVLVWRPRGSQVMSTGPGSPSAIPSHHWRRRMTTAQPTASR